MTMPLQPVQAHGLNPAHRWNAAARIGWVVVALIVLNLFVLGVPERYVQLSALAPASLADLVWLGLTPERYAWMMLAMEGLIVAVFALTAMMLFWHRSSNPMVLFVALMLLLLGVMNGIFVRTPWALATVYPFIEPVLRLLTCATYILFVLFFFLFPDGRFTPRRTVWLAAPIVALVIIWALAPETDFLSIGWRQMLLPITIPLLGSLVGVQIYRYLRVSNETQRQQTRWVVFGVAGSVIVLLEAVFVGQGVVERTQFSVDTTQFVSNLIASFAVLLIPFTFGVAVTRYHLFDIDLLINRALVYTTLTACVVGGYALLVGGFSQLFQTSGNFVISLLATGAVAVAFQPFRAWLQRTVDRLMFGERDDPYRVLARLGQRLEATLAPDAVLPTIVETLRDALKLPYAAITLKQDDILEIVAASGESRYAPVTWPLVYQHEIVGELLLSPRAANEPFSEADRRLLDDLARQVGIAAYAVRLTHDLQRANDDLRHSRERLVTLREEERRRIRRDLHDGLGPALASVTFKVDAARNLLRRDLERADTLLGAVAETTQHAINDIRRLVYGLRPPALDQLGLIGAMREAVSQHQAQGDSVQIAFDTPSDLPTLPAAVEVAAYRIMQEALTNVAKHAYARHCWVSLQLGDDMLAMTISDDGVGLPDERRTGVGLHSIKERAEELGGVCTVQRATGGGTIVNVELPLPIEAEMVTR